MSIRHFIIPDTQVKPGVPTDHLVAAANYCIEKRPDKIIHIGDHWDMQSLGTYDVGKKSFEGRTYEADVTAGNEAMDLFMNPIIKEMGRSASNHKKRWKPEFHFFIGNHEDRINRAVEADRKLEGTIGLHDLALQFPWKVHNYLEPVIIDGVAYCHYFTSGLLGRPVTSARALLIKKHMSCVMGHVQKRDIAYDYNAEGHQLTAIFTGCFYQHDEGYLNPQGNRHWRGAWMLNNVENGSFDEMPLNIKYLLETYL
jgi:hypothetical protein